ncbi:MAG: hypothetical protein HDS39_05220 [Bacteroides sp.]|nr:hypothetical protein [Bacteroides sp.]
MKNLRPSTQYKKDLKRIRNNPQKFVMQVVSAREFRANQGKFLTERICKGLQEVKDIMDGKSKGYSIDELLNEL